MCCFRFTISASYRQEVERHLRTAPHLGHLRQTKDCLAILTVIDGQPMAQVALVLRVQEKTVMPWLRTFCCYGLQGAPRHKPPGCPPTLPSPQTAPLTTWIEEGPVKAGFRGTGWRSPRVQPMLCERFGVYSNVFYIAQVRKHFGVSSPQAACVSDHRKAQKRPEWRTTTWPQILRRAQERNALLLCGDEASFPQGGSLTYPWTRRGQQPQDTTSGKRKGYKVFGLIDYLTGRRFDQGQEGRRTSATSSAFRKAGLEQTTRPILLMQDGSRYHPSAETNAFFTQQTSWRQGCQLPTYAPDYTLMEKLWKKIKQQDTHLHYFPTFEALTEKVEQAVLKCTKTPEEMLLLRSLPTALAQAASASCYAKSFS